MHTRRATLPDVEQLHDLIHGYSEAGTLLPRSLAELCENVRDFIVVEDGVGANARIIGCGALHLYGQHLTEIRSIAVIPGHKGKGAGRLLVEGLLAEAQHHDVSCVCLFTRIPEFFAHFGFRVAKREELPDKIYKDCVNCPKLHACDEIAMVRGELPKFAILDPAHKEAPYKDGLVNLSH
jgi:amino-acid N-acetyltransferase